MSHKDLQWADLDKLYKEVLKRSLDLSDHPCVLYDAISFPRRKYGAVEYGRLRKPNGCDIYAHQVVKLYTVGFEDKMVYAYVKPDEVSHLCHNSLCVNSDHLNIEHQKINKNRQKCNGKRICSTDHVDPITKVKLPDCIIVAKL